MGTIPCAAGILHTPPPPLVSFNHKIEARADRNCETFLIAETRYTWPGTHGLLNFPIGIVTAKIV